MRSRARAEWHLFCRGTIISCYAFGTQLHAECLGKLITKLAIRTAYLVGGLPCDLFRSFFTVEQRRCLLQSPIPGLDDKEIEEYELTGEQANIYNLVTRYSDSRAVEAGGKDKRNISIPIYQAR